MEAINYQGGRNTNFEDKLKQKIIKRLPSHPVKCLDLGCGYAFALEQVIRRHRGEIKDIFDCVDRYAIENIPDYINDYKIGNVEELLDMEGEYDVCFALEVIEHLDKTEILLDNAYRVLKPGGLFFLSHPNLASLYSRIELLLGYQPHNLEASNRYPAAGMGIFGDINGTTSSGSIHHIRGITYRAMREMLKETGFIVEHCYGRNNGLFKSLDFWAGMASDVLYVCRKCV